MTKPESHYYTAIFQDYPDIVDIKQLQSMLDISRHLAYTLIKSGELRAIKIGKAYKIPKVNVIRYVLAQQAPEQAAS